MKEGISAIRLHGSNIAAFNEYPHGSVMDDSRILSQIRWRGTGRVLNVDTADESGRRATSGTTAESK
jgi:hypothetical protein